LRWRVASSQGLLTARPGSLRPALDDDATTTTHLPLSFPAQTCRPATTATVWSLASSEGCAGRRGKGSSATEASSERCRACTLTAAGTSGTLGLPPEEGVGSCCCCSRHYSHPVVLGAAVDGSARRSATEAAQSASRRALRRGSRRGKRLRSPSRRRGARMDPWRCAGAGRWPTDHQHRTARGS